MVPPRIAGGGTSFRLSPSSSPTVPPASRSARRRSRKRSGSAPRRWPRLTWRDTEGGPETGTPCAAGFPHEGPDSRSLRPDAQRGDLLLLVQDEAEGEPRGAEDRVVAIFLVGSQA